MAIFKTSLNADIERLGKRYKKSDEQAFAIWFGMHVLGLNEEDAFEASTYDGANDKGIDLFYVDEDGGRVIVAQTKYAADLGVNVKKAHLNALTGSIYWLSNPEALKKEGRPELVQAAEDYCAAVKEEFSVELHFVYTAPRSRNIEKEIDVYNAADENASQRRSVLHYHAQLIEDVWLEEQETSRRIDATKLPVEEKQLASISGSFGQAVVFSIPAVALKGLYEKHEDRLFDRNVRLYLGSKRGSVNAGIIETLQNPSGRPNFWAYNNGMTLICDKFRIAKDKSSISLRNFCIINGAQTTVSLHRANADLTGISVLARVIAAPSDIIDDIIVCNNSQNQIRAWDIASQDRTQRRLKNDLELLKAPYLYVTRRGRQAGGDLKKFRISGERKKTRQIKMDQAGQDLAAFRGEPVMAYKNKAFIFMSHRHEVFPTDIKALFVLFVHTCGEICREIVRKEISKAVADDVRVLKKGGALFVLAVMSAVLALRNGKTVFNQLDETRATSKAMREKLSKYAEYSLVGYLGRVKLLAAGGELTTLIRQPEFFKKVVGSIEDEYRIHAINKDWLAGALPHLVK